MADNVKNKSKRRLLVKKIIGIFIVIIGVIGLLHQTISNRFVNNVGHDYAIRAINGEVEKDPTDGDFDPSNVSTLTTASIFGNNYTDLPLIGGITIPDLGINLGIFYGMSNANLSVGAGTMKDDQVMGEGNYALASHAIFDGWWSNQLLFSPLHRAEAGQLIYIHDGETVYTYKIHRVFTVDPNEGGYVIYDEPGKTEITLVTCTDTNATSRLIVQGNFVEKKLIKDTDSKIIDSFKKDWTRWW